MNWEMIRTLVAKDFVLYFRNRFFAFVTILALTLRKLQLTTLFPQISSTHYPHFNNFWSMIPIPL